MNTNKKMKNAIITKKTKMKKTIVTNTKHHNRKKRKKTKKTHNMKTKKGMHTYDTTENEIAQLQKNGE